MITMIMTMITHKGVGADDGHGDGHGDGKHGDGEHDDH